MKNLQTISAPTKYHHGHLRQAIMTAAVEMIEESGLEKLSLREIARKLGVTTAAPYHHFKDRHSLMVALAQEGYAELLASLHEERAAAQNAEDELKAAALAYLRFALRRRALYQVMLSTELVEDHRTGVLKDSGETSFEVALSSIAKSTGIGRKESAEAAFCVWALLSGISRLAISGVLQETPAEQERLALEGVRGIVMGFTR
jgi:AcrR family transcriptional regulator